MKFASLFGRILGFLVIIVTLALGPVIYASNTDILSDEVEYEAAEVETGEGETEAEVVLSLALYQADVANVATVSSNISETPAADSYVSGTKTLTISSLTANTTRDLTITYDATGNLTNLMGMEVVAGFGAFIIIFGLLTSGGLMVVMGRGKGGIGKVDFMKVIGSVVLIVVALAMFDSIINYANTLVLAAINASDTLGQTGFGIIPIIVYIGIIGLAGWAQVSTIRKMRRGRRAAYARAYI